MKKYKAVAIVPLNITSDSELNDEDRKSILSLVTEQMDISTSSVNDNNIYDVSRKGEITLVYL